MAIQLEGLPFELEVSCPITVSWRTSSQPPRGNPADINIAQQDVVDQDTLEYLQKRYWETLYLPESLAPVKYLCLDLLRIRQSSGPWLRDPQDITSEDTSAYNNAGKGDEAQGREGISGLVEPDDLTGTSAEPSSDLFERTEKESTEPVKAKKRKHKTGQQATASNEAKVPKSPFDTLLLSIPKLERKHRQSVASLLSREISHYYDVPFTSTSRFLRLAAGMSSPPLRSGSDTAAHPISHRETDIIQDAIKLRFESAKAEEDMINLFRSIDGEVEHWYQEKQAYQSRQQEPGLRNQDSAESREEDDGYAAGLQAAGTIEDQVRVRVQEVSEKKQELLAQSMARRVRLLREQFERREVLLQIILLLIQSHIYPSLMSIAHEKDKDEAREIDLYPDFFIRQRKKQKKARKDSISDRDKVSAEKGRPSRRRNQSSRKNSATTFNLEQDDEAPRSTEAMLDLLADRIALWHAVGVGSDMFPDQNKSTKDVDDALDFDLDTDTDDEHSMTGPPNVQSEIPTLRYTKPSKRLVEEWDWVQRFCVNVVERFFLGINRPFCESLHRKIFGEALTATEPEVQQDRSMEVDRDDTSIHSFHSGTLGERNGGSLSRAQSVASLSSSTRMDRTVSAERTNSVTIDRETSVTSDSLATRKQSNHNTAFGNPLSRTKSTASSSQLFRNRQVGFSRTNSSVLSATGSGSVNIVMGKRKTMIVPIGGRMPTDRKVSGDSLPKQAVPVNRRSTSGGENPHRHSLPPLPSGPATLALATPSKPRANQAVSRKSLAHFRSLDGLETSHNQDVSRHNVYASSQHSADFVAETPAIPNGRHKDVHSHPFRGTTSFSNPSAPLLTHQGNFNRGMPKNLFSMQDEGTDDLADFMVDTDDEDDGTLFSGGRRRSGNLAHRRTSDRQTVEDIPEVPETPLKAG